MASSRFSEYDCKGLTEVGKLIIGSADAVVAQMRSWSNHPNQDIRGLVMKSLRILFKFLQDMWTDARMEYSSKSCGSGDLAKDIGSNFPSSPANPQDPL